MKHLSFRPDYLDTYRTEYDSNDEESLGTESEEGDVADMRTKATGHEEQRKLLKIATDFKRTYSIHS
jgi:hypothetical protein